MQNIPLIFKPIIPYPMMISVISIIAYAIYSNINWSVILYHIAIISYVNLGLILFSSAITIIEENFISRLLLSTLWTTYTCTLVLIYVLAFLGNTIVNTPITIYILFSYLKNINATMDAFNIRPGVALFGSLLFPAIIFYFFFLRAKKIRMEIKKITDSILYRYKKINFIKKICAISLFTLLLLSPIIVYKLNIFAPSRSLLPLKEPIYMVLSKSKSHFASFSKNNESSTVRDPFKKSLSFEKMNIVIIMVDALRPDYLPIYGYKEPITPFLSSIYKSGNLKKIDYSFSSSSMSYAGILSTLRSKFWTNFAQYNYGLHDLLKDQEYKLNFIMSGDHANFYDLKKSYGPNIDFYYDGSLSKTLYLNDDEIIFEGLKNLPKDNLSPAFYYFHLMSVHGLGVKKKENIRFSPASTMTNQLYYTNNYKNGIIQADQNISRIFEFFRKNKTLNKTIFIILGDHGESLGEQNQFMHSNDLSAREIMIPILIYDENKAFKYRESLAMQEDIAPTIINRLGIPSIPTSWEGESLLKPQKRSYSYHYLGNNYSIIKHDHKKVLKYDYNSKTKKESVFNLSVDKKEVIDIKSKIDIKQLQKFKILRIALVRKTEQ